MRDRQPVNVVQVTVAGQTQYAIRYAVYNASGVFQRYDFLLPADDPIEPGTPINKATLLKDTTVASLGLTSSDPLVDEALKLITMPITYLTGGSANAYTLSLPGVTENSQMNGRKVFVRFHTANTSTTININTNNLGNQRVYRYGTTMPSVGQIATQGLWLLENNGSAWIMVGCYAMPVVTQAIAEGGTSTTEYAWTPQRVRQAVDATIITGTYTGDGTSGRTISLGFTPKAVLLTSPFGFWAGNNLPPEAWGYHGGLAVPGYNVSGTHSTGVTSWDPTYSYRLAI